MNTEKHLQQTSLLEMLLLKDLIEIFARATQGHKTVPKSWMSPSSTRNLILDDPCLLWLQHHGNKHGFKKDEEGPYSLSSVIMRLGCEFESAWIKHYAEDAPRCIEDDRDVVKVQSLMRTLELMQRDEPVIIHCPLWWEPLYGTADVICKTSWLYDKFPHLRPATEEPDHYVVIDLKFTRGLHLPAKSKALKMYSAQVRYYSYMIGHLQSYMPKRAFLVSRDRHDDPIAVEITSKLNKPLDADLKLLYDQFCDIKLNGDKYLPWRDEEVRPNFSNAQDAPYSGAKEKITMEYIPGRPLQMLPRVSGDIAAALQRQGYKNLDDLLKVDPNEVPLESLGGIGPTTARQIRAVLSANRENKLPNIPAQIVPQKRKLEMFCDYEFFPDLHCDFNEPWPECLQGKEMLFQIGLGYNDDKKQWRYNEFIAKGEDTASEKKMVAEFLAYLEQLGALDKHVDTAIYHYSSAEKWQSERAAKRLKLPKLADLPWVDLQETVLELPLGTPGSFSFGLKPICKSISKLAPAFAVEWPTGLGNGASAAAVGWHMYQQPEPMSSVEHELLTKYLEVDCRSMERLLSWLRDSAQPAKPSRTASWWPRSIDFLPSRVRTGGWYRSYARDLTLTDQVK